MQIGDFREENIRFSQDQVLLFGKITGDYNPIHFDDAKAIEAKFERKIIHGFLSGSIFSKIIGMDFPGNGSIYLSQTMKFRKPMYVDHDYIARVEIIEIIKEKKRCILKTLVTEVSNGDLCIEGEAVVINKLFS